MKKRLIHLLVLSVLSALVATIGGLVYATRSDASGTQIFLVASIFFVVSLFSMWRLP